MRMICIYDCTPHGEGCQADVFPCGNADRRTEEHSVFSAVHPRARGKTDGFPARESRSLSPFMNFRNEFPSQSCKIVSVILDFSKLKQYNNLHTFFPLGKMGVIDWR